MLNDKFTKVDNFNELRNYVINSTTDNATQDRLLSFIDHEIELLNKRSQKSKEYQQEHKVSMDTDYIANRVSDILNNAAEPMSINDIADKIGESIITPQKIVYRLVKMYKAGNIEKEVRTVKNEGETARKITYYKLVK